MFERFTDRARRVVVFAQEEARELNHAWIGTEHLLLGLIQEGDGVAAQALEALDVSLEDVRTQVEDTVGRGDRAPAGHIPFTSRAKKVLELSLREALALGHNYIGTEHILLGLTTEGEGVGAQVLTRLGADGARVRHSVISLLGGGAPPRPLRQRLFRREQPSMEMEGVRPTADEPDVGLERLTDDALRAVLAAREESRRLGAPELEPEHLLLGLLALEGDPAAALLREVGVTAERLRRALDDVVVPGEEPPGPVPRLGAGMWRVLARAAGPASGTEPIGTIALLSAVVRTSTAGGLAVKGAGGSLEELRARLGREGEPA